MCVVGRIQRNLCSILEENVHCESHHEENSQKNTAFVHYMRQLVEVFKNHCQGK